MKISVIVPCYNEEKILPDSIKKIEQFFFKYRKKYDYELIFVDDGSSDKTKDILSEYALHKSGFKAILCDKNRGKGYAVRKGLLSALNKVCVVLDADLSVKPDNILSIVPKKYPHLTIGLRYQVEKQPIYRRFVGWVFALIVRVLFQWKPKDTQCPWKVLQNIDKRFIKNLNIDGFAYDVELLYNAIKQKIPVSYMDVEYHNNPDSRVTILKTIRMGLDLLKIRFDFL